MNLLAQLRFYCNNANQSCSKYEPLHYTGYCVYSKGIPFTADKVCTNKDVQKEVLLGILSYESGPNNG